MPVRPQVHKPLSWCKPPPKVVDPFYVSPQWRACRKEVLDACPASLSVAGVRCTRDARGS